MPDGFEILHEDGPLLVVNKAAGVATQAPPQFDSLEARIRKFLAARSGDKNAYLGLPHRLDRPVSGVILFATKRRAAFKLSRQFERRSVEKTYWACVEGIVEPAEGTWNDYLWKIHGKPQAMVVEESHPGAQLAVLHYRTLGRHVGGSWLEITLETGRTHQIRVQAGSRGHAVAGDAAYGAQSAFGEPVADERHRAIALHARSICFHHPVTNERMMIVAQVPILWNSLNLCDIQ
jgi:23S rRNA pseudouridine1911/1915/1917 synthase